MAKNITIEIKFDHFADIAKKAHDAVSDIVRKTALDVEGQAKMFVPVDTGVLKNSIDVQMEGDMTAVVAPHTEYAAYVEFGTSRMAAQPYMTPAAEEARPAYIAALTQLEARLK